MATTTKENATEPWPASSSTETTFKAYNTAQSTAYSISRPTYPSALIEIILSHHAATTPHPSNGTLLDVGCGPGTATRSLAPFFHHAFATDPSPAMIETAASIPSTTLSGRPATFSIATAESMPAGITAGTIDLMTAATAVHWFDLAPFYATAAQLLKPGGTLALWTGASLFCHPTHTPNAALVQRILFDLEQDILGPYEAPGNRLSRDMYDALPLPWTVEPAVPALPEALFTRLEWNRDGALEPGATTFFRGGTTKSLDQLARGLGTASMVTRWREANREAVEKGEMEDCVEQTVRRLKEALNGRQELEIGSATVLLMFKKVL